MSQKRTPVEGTIDMAVDTCFSEMEGLRDELQDWYDNLSENFQNSSKGEALQEAIDSIESVDRPDVPTEPEALAILKCDWIEDRSRKLSRSGRRDNAINALSAAKDAAQAWVDEQEDKKAENPSEEHLQMVQNVEEFVDALGEAQSSFEDVQFPGMYG
jgi:hypothetical protein